ncbi:MAG TPA: gliding motility-associated C-terminal domain-containing protein [Puia sp.]|nr:gliding motility-associated C-terminal domain-containing protein [Puia sp.]
MKKGVLIALFCGISSLVYSQDTCFRFTVRPYNIIQNPSFEREGLPCASGFINQYGLTIPYWTTATDEMLTGYLNSCNNFQIPDSIFLEAVPQNRFVFLYPIVPQPIPDGNGVVAVTDFGFDGAPYSYPKHKSYISTCLPVTLEKDSLFRIEFYVGFGQRTAKPLVTDSVRLLPEVSPSPEKFSLFGLPNCPANPLPVVGCPEVGGWVILGSVTVGGGMGSWKKANIDFRATENIQALALGPSCDTNHISSQGIYKLDDTLVQSTNYSYFLDNLKFYRANVPIPVLTISSGSLCENSITLKVTPSIFYSGFDLQWSKNGSLLSGEHGNTITITKDSYGEGSYDCRVVNDSVCLVSDPFVVSWKVGPNPIVLGSADTTACNGDTVLLNAYIDSSFKYSWQDGSQLPYFETSKTGIYTVTMTNDCGTGQSQKSVEFSECKNEVYVPNAFTPNGDGKNDIFRVRFSNPPATYRISIFNRYGQLLYSSTNYSIGWDGTVSGIAQPIDAYAYILEFKDNKNIEHTQRGTVVLIR